VLEPIALPSRSRSRTDRIPNFALPIALDLWLDFAGLELAGLDLAGLGSKDAALRDGALRGVASKRRVAPRDVTRPRALARRCEREVKGNPDRKFYLPMTCPVPLLGRYRFQKHR
jgi:hypothetical protein